MRKVFLFTIILIFLINFALASCGENQVDINSDSAEELDRLNGIGPVKAQAIIETRPFESLDDLIDVYGIGSTTLEKIKNQGIACVESEGEIDNEEVEETPEEVIVEEISYEDENEEPFEPEAIVLNSPKDIKGEQSSRVDERNYAAYGFAAFSIFIGILFLVQRNRYKNEFR